MRTQCAAALADRRLLFWAAAWGIVSLVGFGIVAAIIPNPVFGRQIPPEPFAIGIWIASAPLMGLIAATYTAPAASRAGPTVLVPQPAGPSPSPSPSAENRGTGLGTLAGVGAFLAIGCPVCNKIALVLLGTSGALTVFAPLQPFIGAASLALLAGTLAWRLRLRTRGGACPV